MAESVASPDRSVILVAEDDPDDLMLIKRALRDVPLHNPIRAVPHGQALLDYLYRQGAYKAAAEAPRPGLILLDLNMPIKNGHEALREIKADPTLRHIPVVVLSTSSNEEDINASYANGANAYLIKPITLDQLTASLQAAKEWLRMVRLPD